MKYTLIHFNNEDFNKDWEFSLDVDTVFANHKDCYIKFASTESNGVIILSLTNIPKRIDISTLQLGGIVLKDAWVLSDYDADLLEAPYTSAKRYTGETVFERKDDDK